jgi:lactam utilization protein B
MGEGLGNEHLFMPYISACNIACGGHAGDAETIHRVVSLAKKYGVRIGAHPSYPDRENFGRISMEISEENLSETIQKQISLIENLCKSLDVEIQHIKPHGALYNDITKEPALANYFLNAIEPYKKRYKLYVPDKSVVEKEALRRNFNLVYEAFADRNYHDDLTLVSRKEKGAVLTNIDQITQHIQRINNQGKVRTISGKEIPIKADTFCVHSDTENAVEIVKQIHAFFNR